MLERIKPMLLTAPDDNQLYSERASSDLAFLLKQTQ